ncbi:histidine phosphatase family protein [Dactylosporangium sp. NPDC051484]|uniref:SixA phosphatase family protein n=1 Tax=Dactylosporangium sp. NPDC051484 TaxID=3154942 RepID=UPI003450E2ED
MTVRTLILLRHAKAANPDDYATDIERPLTARGHRDAAAAGHWLRKAGLVPDAVLCSTAVRTRQTLDELRLAGEVPVTYEHRIYVGPADDTLDLIRHVDATVATLLLVGHNPTISDLSDTLAPRALADGGLATSGIAVHRFNGSWRGLESAGLTDQHTARG